MCIYELVYMRICVYIYMCVCVSMYMCMRVYMCVTVSSVGTYNLCDDVVTIAFFSWDK